MLAMQFYSWLRSRQTSSRLSPFHQASAFRWRFLQPLPLFRLDYTLSTSLSSRDTIVLHIHEFFFFAITLYIWIYFFFWFFSKFPTRKNFLLIRKTLFIFLILILKTLMSIQFHISSLIKTREEDIYNYVWYTVPVNVHWMDTFSIHY